jgi:hypothetical protein
MAHLHGMTTRGSTGSFTSLNRLTSGSARGSHGRGGGRGNVHAGRILSTTGVGGAAIRLAGGIAAGVDTLVVGFGADKVWQGLGVL